jgi:hypothetical protein
MDKDVTDGTRQLFILDNCSSKVDVVSVYKYK